MHKRIMVAVFIVASCLATSAQAARIGTIWNSIGELQGAQAGTICDGRAALLASVGPACLNPIGVGTILMRWSDGHWFVAIVRDLDGDEICFAGAADDFSPGMKVAPVPGALGLRLVADCMAKFGQTSPTPKAAFLVWR